MKVPHAIRSLSHAVLYLSLTLGALAPLGFAEIVRVSLEEMVARTDNAIYGTITAKKVIRIDHPKDGPELYFTSLTIEGTSLRDGKPTSATVWFGGGFIDATHGVWNSEAPKTDDQKVGNRVVAFYKWTDNMGGGQAGNALFAWHGGLYRTFEAPKGVIVQGRGNGYAVPQNVTLDELRTRIADVAKTR
jgi:hypothetical protein